MRSLVRVDEVSTIEEAVEFWQSKTSRSVTVEDGREIVSNVTGFFQLLDQWDRSANQERVLAKSNYDWRKTA